MGTLSLFPICAGCASVGTVHLNCICAWLVRFDYCSDRKEVKIPTASSTHILVAPDNIDLLSNLCSCSFLSVSNHGSIPDRQPLRMCFLSRSVSSRVSCVRRELTASPHLCKKVSKFCRIFSLQGVFCKRTSPWSLSSLNISPNSFWKVFFRGWLACKSVLHTLWQAWKRSSFTGVFSNIYWYLFLTILPVFLQKRLPLLAASWQFFLLHS